MFLKLINIWKKYIMHELQLSKVMFFMRLSRYKSFKMDTFLNILCPIVFLTGTILFWYIIDDIGFILDGWTYNELLVFVAFSELFYGIEQNVFGFASLFWQVIYMGNLDTMLLRPINPKKRFLRLNIDYIGLWLTFVKFALILILSGIFIGPIKLLLGILVVFLSNYILMLIRYVICYGAFWGGRMDAITEICDSFTKFNKYPLVIFPKLIQLLFQTLVPFYFFSTLPSQLVLSKLTNKRILVLLIALGFCLIFWKLIDIIVWKKGRKVYESISG